MWKAREITILNISCILKQEAETNESDNSPTGDTISVPARDTAILDINLHGIECGISLRGLAITQGPEQKLRDWLWYGVS